jgi:hypothetical protein
MSDGLRPVEERVKDGEMQMLNNRRQNERITMVN